MKKLILLISIFFVYQSAQAENKQKLIYPEIWARQIAYANTQPNNGLNLYKKENGDIGIVYYETIKSKNHHSKAINKAIELSFFGGEEQVLSYKQLHQIAGSDLKGMESSGKFLSIFPVTVNSDEDKLKLKDSVIQTLSEVNSPDGCANMPRHNYLRKLDNQGNTIKEVVILVVSKKEIKTDECSERKCSNEEMPNLSRLEKNFTRPLPKLFGAALSDNTFLYYTDNLVVRFTPEFYTKSKLLNNKIFVLDKEKYEQLRESFFTVEKKLDCRGCVSEACGLKMDRIFNQYLTQHWRE